MRKLTKKALSLVLCVMLVISAFGCAISVFAETPGTTEVGDKIVYDAPFDLDGSNGLTTWIGNTSPEGNPMFVAEEGVIKGGAGIQDYDTGWQPVSPAYFKIPDAFEGMGVQFSYDIGVDATIVSGHEHYNWNMLKVQIVQYNADGTEKARSEQKTYKAWEYVAGTKTSEAFRIDDTDEFFQIVFSSPRNPSYAWRVSNITYSETTPPPAPEVIEPDEEYEFDFDEIDAPSYYGTADQGFSSLQTSSYPVYLKPSETIANLDFEAGFVYWSGQKVEQAAADTLVYPSDNFKLVPDGDNIYLTIKNAGYSKAIQTTFFDVSSKLAVGDTVVLVYDAKGEDATKIRPLLKQDAIRPVEYDAETGMSTTLNPNGNGNLWDVSNGSVYFDIITNAATQSEFAVQTDAEGWTTYVTGAATIFDPTVYNATASNGIYLQVKVGAASGISTGDRFDAAIDNIRIAKVVDGVYTDIATGEVIYDASEAPEGPPSYYGSEKHGFDSTYSSWPMALKPVDGVQNLNFDQGFIYWSGKKYTDANNPGSLASDSFKLVTDGENKYITLKDSGYVNTMRTALFKLTGVNVGDTLALLYDVKGADADKIRVTLLQEHLRGEDQGVTYDAATGLHTATYVSPGSPNTLVNGTATLITTDLAAADGWTTYATSSTKAVNDPTTVSTTRPCTSDIYVQVVIERASGVEVGDQLDVAIDNIRIAKVVDKVYYDVTTGEEIFDASKLAPSYYGTADKGFNSQHSSYPLALKPVDEIKNLDFSEGFIYWSGKLHVDSNNAGSYASDSFALVTEGDNTYITLKEEGYVNTMRSALFKAEGVHVGEQLVLVYDVKGEDANKLRVTLLQHHLRGEDQGVVYDEVTGMNTDPSGKSATPGTPTYLVNSAAGRAELSTADGWSTYVTDYSAFVSDPTLLGGDRPCTADIYLQVVVDKAPSVLAGDELDVAIDNIRIAKVIDGMYYDVVTGAVIGLEVVHEYPEENADTLAAMVAAILAGDSSAEYDFNYDGKVDLLDVVALKKYLADVL